MKKRMLSLLLALVFVAGLLPVQGAAAAGLTAAQADSYTAQLQSAVNAYGIGKPDTSNEPGVYYAAVLDLNADGVQELFYLYAPTDDSHIANIAVYSYQNENLICWFDKDFLHAYGAHDIRSIAIGKGQSGAYYLQIDDGEHYDSERGGSVNQGTIQALDGGMAEIATYQSALTHKRPDWQSGDPLFYQIQVIDAGKTIVDTEQPGDAYQNTGLSEIPFSERDQLREKYGLGGAEVLANEDAGSLDMQSNDVAGLLAELSASATIGLTPADLLARLPYVGDISKCKMTPAMANAFADVLAEAETRGEDLAAQGALFDGGNGIPILWICWGHLYSGNIVEYANGELYEWDGQQAVKSWVNTASWSEFIVTPESAGQMIYGENGTMDADVPSTAAGYHLSGGRISETPQDIGSHAPSSENQLSFGGAGMAGANGPWADAALVAATLRAFADSGPSYTFPAVTDDEALVKAIAEAVAAKLGGEITGIYQLADGLWYVVITVDGTTKGAVVQAVKSGGKLTYEVLDSHDTPAEEDVLQGLTNDFQSKPNLSPDYAATEDFTSAKEYEDYLKKLLDNIPGGTPNDAAKGELAAFLENSVSRVSTVTVSAS